MIFIIIFLAAIGVAYANGANDSFKGVATLFGSKTTSYKKALLWATGTTLLGSLAAFLMAENLIKAFGGKGLIEDAVAIQPEFAAAVAIGAALTVLVATRIGMPISTTHSLIGALLGTGLVAGSSIHLGNLGAKFLLPLLTSPIIAVVATSIVYKVFRSTRIRLGVSSEYCICIGQERREVLLPATGAVQMLANREDAVQHANQITVTTGETATCHSRYSGKVIGIEAEQSLNKAHFLSSGVVSFARGLNDTPKIAALLLLLPAMGVKTSLVAVGIAIAAGALLSARRVAETMSQKITTMNHGQGFTSNLVTGLIVIGASRFGLPVSTTHVSCGSLFGLGAVTGGASKKMIVTILMAWVATLPLAAAIGATSYTIIRFSGCVA